MQRPLALLALAVLSWSNATVLQCGASALPADAGPSPEQHAGHGGQGGHDHAGAPTQRGAPGHDHDPPTSHPESQDCGVVMACGTALAAPFAAGDLGRPAQREALEPAHVATPSTADLTRDPPPPRRTA